MSQGDLISNTIDLVDKADFKPGDYYMFYNSENGEPLLFFFIIAVDFIALKMTVLTDEKNIRGLSMISFSKKLHCLKKL